MGPRSWPNQPCRPQYDSYRMVDGLGQSVRRERPALRTDPADTGSLPDDGAEVRAVGAVQFLCVSSRGAGGTNAFLDTFEVTKQQTLVSAVVEPFHDVPYLSWDLINEPSFS